MDWIDEIPDEELSPRIFKPEIVRESLLAIPKEALSGDDPEEFAREMGVGFYYGEQRLFVGVGDTRTEILALVRRSDLPKSLRKGFGKYEAATMRSLGGSPKVNLHESEVMAEIEWKRMMPEEVACEPDFYNLLKDL